MKQKKHTKWLLLFLALTIIVAEAASWMASAAYGSTDLISGYRVEEDNDFILPARNKRASSSATVKYKTNSWWIFKEPTNADSRNRDYSYYDSNGLKITANIADTSDEDSSGYFYNYYLTDAEEIVNQVLGWYTVNGVPNREELTDDDGVTVYACRALTVVKNGSEDGTYYNYNAIADPSVAKWSAKTKQAFKDSYDIPMTLKFHYTDLSINVIDKSTGTAPNGYTNTYNENMLLYGETVSFNWPGSLEDYGYEYIGFEWTSGRGVIDSGSGTSTDSFYVDYTQITGDDLVLTFYYKPKENLDDNTDPTPTPAPDAPSPTPTPSPSPTPTPIPYYTLSVNVSSYGGGTFDVAGYASDRTSYSRSFIEGSRVSLSADAYSDYIFDHWSVNGSTYSSNSITVTMNSRRSATAYFRPEYITVTFDPNGGVCDTATTTTQYGSTYGTLPTPTRVGYDFAGWYTQATGGRLLDETTTVTEKYNHYIYAHWTPRDDTKYIVNHWKENVYGDGYTLAGTDNLEGTTDTQVIPDVNTYDGFTSPPTQSININADGSAVLDYYYARNSYALILYTGKGIDSVSGAGTYKYEETVTLDATPSTGYKWLEWTGDSFTQSRKNYSFTMPYNNLWRMALAVPITYQVKYNPSGATGAMANSLHTYDEGKTLSFNAYNLTYKVDYDLNLSTIAGTPFSKYGTEHTDAKADFLGWSDTAGGSVKYTNGRNVKNLSTVDGDIVNLYAVWQPGTVVMPNAVLSGYTLTGWKKDNTGTLYGVNDEYTPASDVTMYAQWSANTYTVTFDANGGTCGTTSKSVTYNSTYGTLPTPTKYGYKFNGWWYSAQEVESTTTVTTASNHTLIAQWVPENEITVTFDWNFDYKRGAVDGETNCSYDSMVVSYGEIYGALPAPTREGYAFAGWYTSETSAGNGTGTRITSGTYVTSASSHTLYACWVPFNSTIIYDYNYDYSVWPNGN